jgi:asparagine synthase (glutamine-hydrolysing)
VRALGAPDADERLRAWFAPFTAAERLELIGSRPSSARPALEDVWRSGDPLRRMLAHDVSVWLPDNLLERGDRMSMAASVELRPPFLDHRVVELAFSLPSSVKVHGRTSKWVVKELARRYLPDAIVDRPKVGFKVPLDRWFREGLRDTVRSLLLDNDAFVPELLDRRAVNRLVTAHESGERNEDIRIWTLMSLEVWARTFLAGTTSAATSVR